MDTPSFIEPSYIAQRQNEWSQNASVTVRNFFQNVLNVRGCWFFRSAPKELRDYAKNRTAIKEIPAFKILKDEDGNIVAQVEGKQMPLKTLVSGLLNRKLKFCEHIRLSPKQQVTIVFFETTCWKCKKPQHLYTVEQNLSAICSNDFHVYGSMWDSEDIDKNPQIYEAVKQFLKTDRGKHLKVGELKERYSNTVSHRYLSHGCFYCNVIWGDFPLHTKKIYGIDSSNSIRHVVEVDLGTMTEKKKHWCYSENGEFCE